MGYDTTLERRPRGGLKAQTIVPLPFQIEGKQAELDIYTSKNERGLTTFAHVRTRSGSWIQTRIFRDWGGTIHRAPPGTRATEKAIRTLHEQALQLLDKGVMEACLTHHAKHGDLMPLTEAGKAAGYTLEHLGLIPFFLVGEGTAQERLDTGYQKAAGCGFSPMEGWDLWPDDSVAYRGDADRYEPMATAKIGDETVHFYDGAWVAVVQPDRSFVIARMD